MNSGRSISPRSTQIHQGWLKKKGKRRWFILQGNSLYWFAKEQKAVTFQHKDVKGCLELKGYAVSVNTDKPHTFVVSNLREMNYYELTAPTDESMNEWLECIRSLIQKTGEAEATNEPQFEKRGVLKKKGQDRLFVLKDDSLMWFLSKTGAEKKAKGSLPLKEVTVKRGPKGYSFVLQPKVGKAYTLFASSQSECDDWMAAVSRVIDDLNSTQTTIKSGWLEKKGQKRYFMIKNGKLLWFNKMQKGDHVEANGYLLLDSCNVSLLPPANGKYSLHVISQGTNERTKREYTLTATSETECTDWVTALVGAGATGNAASLSAAAPNRRLSVRHTPPADALSPGSRAGSGVGIKLSDGSYVARAALEASSGGSSPDGSTNQSNDFLVAEKSGWLEKKGKRRWFVLAHGEFAWYDQPKQHEKGEKANGSLVAKEASVASIGEIGNGYFAFAVYSATAREAEYLLQASSLNEMEDWVVALVLAGASPDKDRASTTVDTEGASTIARPDGLPENDKNGWMEKKGRKRWFVLRNGHLYWYKAVQENETGLKEATGSLDLSECSVKKLAEKLKGKSALLISSSSKGGEYLLLHQDEEEIASWVKLIIEKGGASKWRAEPSKYGQASGATPNYFGLSLQQLLEKEGTPQHGIPILVQKCVEYIRQHGMEAEGIFRVSGEQIDIVALKQEFETTPDTNSITFPPNMDVHAVSGLLKMFFRELNPPLMTFDLYSDFMSAAGCVMSEIKNLLAKLPAENKILLKYLMSFLYDVAQLGDCNKMRPMNLAIVFSPNLFRSDKSAFEVLANSSNAATVTQFIISNTHELFPDEATSSASASASASASTSAPDPVLNEPGYGPPPVPGGGAPPPVLPPPDLPPPDLPPPHLPPPPVPGGGAPLPVLPSIHGDTPALPPLPLPPPVGVRPALPSAAAPPAAFGGGGSGARPAGSVGGSGGGAGGGPRPAGGGIGGSGGPPPQLPPQRPPGQRPPGVPFGAAPHLPGLQNKLAAELAQRQSAKAAGPAQ